MSQPTPPLLEPLAKAGAGCVRVLDGLLCGAHARWHVLWEDDSDELRSVLLCDDHAIEVGRDYRIDYIHLFRYPCTHPAAEVREDMDENGKRRSWCELPEPPAPQSATAQKRYARTRPRKRRQVVGA